MQQSDYYCVVCGVRRSRGFRSPNQAHGRELRAIEGVVALNGHPIILLSMAEERDKSATTLRLQIEHNALLC
ncbi:hypothetical protein PGT21_018987 [Puccinia graminis f. sp. tritici]|uniref:Uncharacterized protein n=1 Tax=Puccinia graminis f. sp. tritici TaxID=56615 RepID=A0A5B0LPN3_PUCGR|nr:hypothetical protein PGT21_018987 [Puccinia graminis f. sp. tritici]KAA1095932.1 hypothetical protein PGTUg99_035760 [Puccinia graminis f. sp. tritici]KAA1130325.1 hypothetical protein PGTUg99_016673 [Puccinia graminis f. sp. tritici]